MQNKLIDLKCKIADDNSIFGENAYYFKDTIEFKNGGCDDNRMNLFYIRPLSLNPNKYRIVGKNAYNLLIEKANYRIIFQLTNIDKHIALQTLRDQLLQNSDIIVTSYSDDTAGIYLAEYGKEKEFTNDRYLLSFDFEVSNEFIPTICNCLTIEMCSK